MGENNFSTRQESQVLLEEGKGTEGGKFRYRLFVFILLLAGVLLFYKMNLTEMAADWSPKRQNHSQMYTTTPHPTVGFDGKDSSTKSPAVNSTSTNGPNEKNTTVLGQHEAVPNISLAVTQKAHTTTIKSTTVVHTPVPYVSPGPYVVEYPYEYHLVINEPGRCNQQKPFVVLIVPVAPHDRAARSAIRRTWGSESLIQGKVVSLFFLLGLPKGEEAEQIQDQVQKESTEHRDLLQGDFLDCYKNLTIKTMVMLEWLDSYCPNTTYAMKIDSDMFLNANNLVKMLLSAPKLNYMTGLVERHAVVLRHLDSKWRLPVEVFPASTYPPYVLGLGYVFSLDLPRKLVEASRYVKAVYIEDVYLGLCLKHLHILPTEPPDANLFHVNPVPYDPCVYTKIIATTTNPDTDLEQVWKSFSEQNPMCPNDSLNRL